MSWSGLALAASLAVGAPAASSIEWQDWSEAAFRRAAAEKRLLLLDLGAVWCHWCHVMDETTYRDPEVVSLLERHFVTVRVDQDSRPDLANRYEDYGWPATIVFDSAGGELVRFRGYIPPPRMRALLQAVVEDPTPGPSVTGAPATPLAPPASMTPGLREELERLHLERYDSEHGGWGFVHKYLDLDSVEYALRRARAGDEAAARMARDTLERERALFDPVWGGVYQYSDGGVWTNPHFEKIMSFQAAALRGYAAAWSQWRDPAHLRAAREVHRYLRGFLRSPQGAFYASQDADAVPGQHAAGYFALSDSERRRRGVPRVDRSLYARENGWAVEALAELHRAAGDAQALEDALAAARWLLEHRALPGGGFAHGEGDRGGPFLADTVAAGRGFLALYETTRDRRWLEHAQRAADFIDRTFRRPPAGGYVSAAPGLQEPLPNRDENVAVGRFGARLHRLGGRAADATMARQALGYLARPEVARRFSTAGVLLLLEELPDERVAGE
jgi:uncharacterized protein YyaL (SSP411 family)